MAEIGTFGRRENPVLNSRTFEGVKGSAQEEAMSVGGAVQKTAILLAILLGSAAWGWLSFVGVDDPGFLFVWLAFAAPGAFIVGLITAGNMRLARFTAPLYAFLEGGLLGAISAVMDAVYPGVAIMAVALTSGTLAGLLLVYRLSGFQVTAKFRAGVAAATLAIAAIYAASFVLQLMGIQSLPFFHQSDPMGIYIGLFILIIAALNLVMDFDLIESAAREGAPDYME